MSVMIACIHFNQLHLVQNISEITSYPEWKSCVQRNLTTWVGNHMEDKSCVQWDLRIWVDKHMEEKFYVQRDFIPWVDK
jgi:hypothetical protein